ncbi:MAG TPA: hypothetical protein VIC62_19550 [Nakamurella sp.]|jgi:hypothetical protein
MTRDDGEQPELESPTQPAGEPAGSRADPADSTGTWAYVSPFATSPESFGPAPDPASATSATAAGRPSTEGADRTGPTLGPDPSGQQAGWAATPV